MPWIPAVSSGSKPAEGREFIENKMQSGENHMTPEIAEKYVGKELCTLAAQAAISLS